MKRRAALILIFGLIAAVAGYASLYWIKTSSHRVMMHCAAPELVWLQNEFGLDEAEFQRIQQLHDGYQSSCRELCRQVDEKHARLKELLSEASQMTPEIEQALDEAGALRSLCQKRMFSHFLEVSRSMPSDQAKRYLSWIQEQTLRPEHSIHAIDSTHSVHSGHSTAQ